MTFPFFIQGIHSISQKSQDGRYNCAIKALSLLICMHTRKKRGALKMQPHLDFFEPPPADASAFNSRLLYYYA